jgi:hypothetical protein
MKCAMVIAAAIVLSLLIPSTLVGWGPEGHEIVASLAQTRLTENAKWGIRSLLGDASLASVANWADEVLLPLPKQFSVNAEAFGKVLTGSTSRRFVSR